MARALAVIAALVAALVCGYLCLAGFEYPGVTVWKVTTGALAVLFLGLAAVAAARGHRS